MNNSQKSSSRINFAILLLTVTLGALVSTGCRTMEGAGKDIERAGEKIQDNAK